MKILLSLFAMVLLGSSCAIRTETVTLNPTAYTTATETTTVVNTLPDSTVVITQQAVPHRSALPDNRLAQDDLMNIPTGVTYRNNRDPSAVGWSWKEPETVTIGLSKGSTTFKVIYRASIETMAGTYRNNIIQLSMVSDPLSDHTPNLYITDAPAGLSFSQIGEDQLDWRPADESILVIDIAPGTPTGYYRFNIGIVVQGVDYGTVPCTVTVTLPSSSSPDFTKPGPIPMTLMSGVNLTKIDITEGTLDTFAHDADNYKLYQAGDKCIIVNITVRNDKDYDLDVSLYAAGYDAEGKQVGFILIPGALKGTQRVTLPKRTSLDFTFLMNWSPEPYGIRIISGPLLYTPVISIG